MRLDGIELADNGTKHDRTDFVFPSHAQVKFVAGGGKGTLGAGICVCSCADAGCASRKR